MSRMEIIPEAGSWDWPRYWDSHSNRYRDYRRFPLSPRPMNPAGQVQPNLRTQSTTPDPQTTCMPHVSEDTGTESLVPTPEDQGSKQRTSEESNPWEYASGQATPGSSASRQAPNHSCHDLVLREEQIWNQALPGYNLFFHYQHNSIKDPDAYHAVVLVRARNMEKLMKKGLYLNKKNAKTRDSFIVYHNDPAWNSRSEWKVIRSYKMSDKSFFGNKNWTAVVWVYANALAPVTNFRITDLTSENCAQAKAWDRHLMYFYDKNSPELNINTLLDDQPMGEIWPWPRSEQSSLRLPEPRALRALQDISACTYVQRGIPSNLPYPDIVRVLKGIWSWLCGVFSFLTLLKPDATRRWDDVLVDYIGCVCGMLAVYLLTFFAIYVFALPFFITDDVLGKKTLLPWLRSLL